MTKQKSKRSPARVLLRIVLALLALLVLAAVVFWAIPLTERDDGVTASGAADWMNNVDGSLTLSELAIPGTHDSATQYVQLGFFSKCQAKDIRGQLPVSRYPTRRGRRPAEADARLHELQNRPDAVVALAVSGRRAGAVLCLSERPPV